MESEDIKVLCIECNQEFIISRGEQEFYKSKSFRLPKRCKTCRDKKNMEGPYSDLSTISNKLNIKRSTFLDNAQIFGMPTDVSGGLSIEHFYYIEILLIVREDIIKCYYLFDVQKNLRRFTKHIKKATTFREKKEAEKICIELLLKKNIESAKVFARGNYEHGFLL